MSPASKSKAKDKSSAKTNKEQPKASSKPSANGTTGSGITASAYNPLSGTFHTLETAPTASSPPPHSNGRFRNIDETDDHSGSSLGTGAEYDSVSNNGGYTGSDNDKREKTRQKNERKHQRQRERRAQELHERCSGYLMSRKLEALAQQLVAMGFSSERATMSLILNEGRIEESVAWLLEGSEDTAQHKDSNLDCGSNLKIDITEELSQITVMETKYKCSKQEVERAIVTCEGDLEKADETLRTQKQELPSSPPKPEDIGDPSIVNGGKLVVSSIQTLQRPQYKTNPPILLQQRRDDRDFNYTKAAPPVSAPPESANRNFQPLRRIQPKAEWIRPQVAAPVEKRWPNGGSSASVSYSLASPLQAAPPAAKPEARYVVVGSEAKNLPTGSVREPVIMMQRPQSINTKQNHPVTSMNATPAVTAGCLSAQQFYLPSNHQPYVSSPLDTPASGWGNSHGTTGSSSSSTSSLTVPASLGLFSGWGSAGASGSSSPVDWNTGGSMPQCDYASIDWTLDSTLPSRSNGLWLGLASFVKNSRMYDSWSPSTSADSKPTMRPASSNGIPIPGRQEGVAAETSSASTSEGQSEWTSPFAGKDLFSVPRQFVTSPSL
ncbi:hypothetical protein IFM89_036815 [Coptis chinensis]|uniref:UBA domain-containing protein n=1 Tax=Coptis chinensis TaxID=261450 RepID=A0A835HJP7_9MAGN|nr:hypothetical protein IFM89_036815 [Coptis chinensis]